MDLRKVKTLLELFENSAIAEMEISEGEEKIRLARHPQHAPAPSAPVASAPAPMVHAPPAPPLATAGGEAAADGEAATSASSRRKGTVVTSPMVGTFYSASSPEKEPYVKVGAQIQEGDTLCIIEAMKLMNELPSPAAGRVVEILVENGDPVAFGDELFVIE